MLLLVQLLAIFHVLRQHFLHEVGRVVPIDTMTITNSQIPMILNGSEVLYDEIVVLILLVRLVRHITTPGLPKKLLDDILGLLFLLNILQVLALNR